MANPEPMRFGGSVALIRPADPSRCGARRREWLLSWRPPPGGTEPRCAVVLRFHSLDAALAHARAEGWPVEVSTTPAARPRRAADTTPPLEPPPPRYWWALEGRAAPYPEAA
jgi:hypothetical protein